MAAELLPIGSRARIVCTIALRIQSPTTRTIQLATE